MILLLSSKGVVKQIFTFGICLLFIFLSDKFECDRMSWSQEKIPPEKGPHEGSGVGLG